MTMLDCVLALSSQSDLTQYIVTRPNNDWRLSKFSEAGIAYATTNLNTNLRALSRYKLARIIHRFQPDIIQYWKARAGRFTFSKYRARSVAWHGGTAHFSRLSGCDWHLGSSPQVVARLLEDGVAEDHVFVVSPFAGGVRNKPLTRTEFDVPEKAPLALVLSRLHAKKGLNTLMEAVSSVEGLHVLIAGDGPMRRALTAQIKAQRLDDRVHFLGWRNDSRELLDLCDLVVCPSRIDPFGKVVIDAWAAEKPVVATDAIGPATLITPGKTGLLVRRGDDDALAAAISHMIKSPEDARRMGQLGRKAYDAEFGERAFVKQTLSVYERVLQSAGSFK